MAYQPNLGRIPPECEIRDEHGNVTGYRAVHVVLFGGLDTRKAGHAPWPAGGARPRGTPKEGRGRLTSAPVVNT